MSIFNSLNPLSMVSNAVESAFDAVLPKQLEFLGDVAGLLTDLETGNYLKCLDDAQDLLKDLPQQLGELTKNKGAGPGGDREGDLAACSGFVEPTPPPPYPAAAPADDSPGPGLQGLPPSAPSGQTASERAVLRRASVPPPAGPSAPSSTARSARPTAAGVVRGTPSRGKADRTDHDQTVARSNQPAKTEKTSKSNDAARGNAADEASGAPRTEKSKTKEPEGKKSASTQAASKAMTPDAFFKLSDKAMMDAVRDGKIPDSVKSDPEQMRRLQVRMEDIAQMNSIISNMLNTMHEMNKAIIQNLRV